LVDDETRREEQPTPACPSGTVSTGSEDIGVALTPRPWSRGRLQGGLPSGNFQVGGTSRLAVEPEVAEAFWQTAGIAADQTWNLGEGRLGENPPGLGHRDILPKMSAELLTRSRNVVGYSVLVAKRARRRLLNNGDSIVRAREIAWSLEAKEGGRDEGTEQRGPAPPRTRKDHRQKPRAPGPGHRHRGRTWRWGEC